MFKTIRYFLLTSFFVYLVRYALYVTSVIAFLIMCIAHFYVIHYYFVFILTLFSAAYLFVHYMH